MGLLIDILAGILLGMCYDLLKAFRKQTKISSISILSDILFWGCSLSFCIWLFLLTGDFKFRFYELFGATAGFLFYFWMVSDLFAKIAEKVAQIFLLFLGFLFTILKFFGIMIKNGVLFVLKPLRSAFKIGKKGASSGFRKWKQNWKLMKRI